jgi:hypothetical protein
MNGGDPASWAQSAGRALSASDYVAIGNWLDGVFQRENVCVVLMPAAEFDSDFIKGLDTNPNWRAVFMDGEQRLYIDIKSQQGKDLYTGLFTGQTKFPDRFSMLLTIGYNLVRMQEDDKISKGFEFMTQAFTQQPSQAVAIELLRATNHYPQLRDTATNIFRQYFDDFVEKEQTYRKQNNYREKVLAAALAGDYLANINYSDPNLVDKYRTSSRKLMEDQQWINKNSRW